MDGGGKTILLVDDEPNVTRLAGARLQANGYSVVTAADGAEALAAARRLSPDLMILDLNLPKLDGFEVARRLKADGSTRGIPIVILSARTQEADLIRGRELGVEGYLTKPFQSQELLNVIAGLIGRRGDGA